MNEKNLKLKETFILALQNHQKNNFKIAENLYKKILKINPDHFESISNLGSLSVQTKNFNQAKLLFIKAIKIKPDSARALNNLGILFGELEQSKIAVNYFQKAIKIQPNFSTAHYNLGKIFDKSNEFQKAIACYEKAIQMNPKYINAYNNLGNVFEKLGEFQKAAGYYEKVISIDSNHVNIIHNLSALLKKTKLDNINETNSSNLKKLFLFLFRKNNVYHSDIFSNAKLLLFIGKNNNIVRKIVNSDSLLLKNKIIQNLLKEELFLLMLQKSLISDQFLEKMLTKLRYEILFTLFGSNQKFLEEIFELVISLGEQCFCNEFIYSQSKKEIDYINRLKNSVEDDKKINELRIAILSCYFPLYSLKNIRNKLLNYKSKNVLFNDLITMQIKEPLREKKLINSIKSLGKISDVVSRKVRGQYEEHPYPRWRYTYSNLPTNFLTIINDQIKPNKIKINHKFINPNVFIAGCGTGKHILSAEDYLNANILGVDISRASLAFAKRKTEELGFKNIEFLHADILQLQNLNRKFDIIECVGVLHHMKDPLKGLKVLLKLLEPHGLLKLGLYSKLARQDVIRARKFIKKNKFKNTVESIRNFRKAVAENKEDQILQKVLYKKDFYSTSSVRDFLFHVQELHFTLPQLSKMLKNLNLEFLGFTNLLVKKKFSKFFPNDSKNTSLNNWNQFEMNNPHIFSTMYQFWVRKIQ